MNKAQGTAENVRNELRIVIVQLRAYACNPARERPDPRCAGTHCTRRHGVWLNQWSLVLHTIRENTDFRHRQGKLI
ncbi:MAG: hypothetical protein H0V62_15120 [Gammaproteobacteria bacterium]|nr:hypothetical protein [Gammaproteobacteria bacterium]MBA3731636.1 hypothetical protein [Gammaproteobacteria bacterium]